MGYLIAMSDRYRARGSSYGAVELLRLSDGKSVLFQPGEAGTVAEVEFEKAALYGMFDAVASGYDSVME